MLPVIATSLARMGNAESPMLRHKVASFKSRLPAETGDFEPSDEGGRTVRGIEKSAWEALLATIKTPSLRGKSSRIRTRAARPAPAQLEAGPEYSSQQPLAVPCQLNGVPTDSHQFGNESHNMKHFPEQFPSTPFDKQDSRTGHRLFPLNQTSSPICFDFSNDGFDTPSTSMNGLMTDNVQSNSSYNGWSESSPMNRLGFTQAIKMADMQVCDQEQLDPEAFQSFDQWLYRNGSTL